MSLFHFKKKKIINSKFHMKDMVAFRHNGELVFGFVYDIRETEAGEILYDVQVCGQCPWFVYDIKEEKLRPYEQPEV